MTYEETDYLIRRAMLIESQQGNDTLTDMLGDLKDLNEAFSYMERGELPPQALQVRIKARQAEAP